MTIPLFQVDAFSHKLYQGNPAAVCILTKPAADHWMSTVAAEMNLSETAFVVPNYAKQTDGKFCNHYGLKWFTPSIEVDLCGHATLAAAKVLYDEAYCDPRKPVSFNTRSGHLTAQVQGDYIELTLPTERFTTERFTKERFTKERFTTEKFTKEKFSIANINRLDNKTDKFNTDSVTSKDKHITQQVMLALGIALDNAQTEVIVASNKKDLLWVLDNEQQVLDVTPDYVALAAVNKRMIIISAKSDPQNSYDFVARVFVPSGGINEDPVTGSAYCLLGPYWSQQLNSNNLTARQVSMRGGDLIMEVFDQFISLRGRAVIVFKAELYDHE